MLTKEEQALAANAAILLTKNKIIQEVYELFGKLADDYKPVVAVFPEDVIRLHPKISKGENYQGLPWVMLDYPRNFIGKDAFAIRSMFWWGHYFSLHLLLQGDKMKMLQTENLSYLEGWQFTIADNPWQHHFDPLLSIPLTHLHPADIEKQTLNQFYKISIYLPLQQWDTAALFFREKFAEVLQLVNRQRGA